MPGRRSSDSDSHSVIHRGLAAPLTPLSTHSGGSRGAGEPVGEQSLVHVDASLAQQRIENDQTFRVLRYATLCCVSSQFCSTK